MSRRCSPWGKTPQICARETRSGSGKACFSFSPGDSCHRSAPIHIGWTAQHRNNIRRAGSARQAPISPQSPVSRSFFFSAARSRCCRPGGLPGRLRLWQREQPGCPIGAARELSSSQLIQQALHRQTPMPLPAHPIRRSPSSSDHPGAGERPEGVLSASSRPWLEPTECNQLDTRRAGPPAHRLNVGRHAKQPELMPPLSDPLRIQHLHPGGAPHAVSGFTRRSDARPHQRRR
jgi:hypothetical protein